MAPKIIKWATKKISALFIIKKKNNKKTVKVSEQEMAGMEAAMLRLHEDNASLEDTMALQTKEIEHLKIQLYQQQLHQQNVPETVVVEVHDSATTDESTTSSSKSPSTQSDNFWTCMITGMFNNAQTIKDLKVLLRDVKISLKDTEEELSQMRGLNATLSEEIGESQGQTVKLQRKVSAYEKQAVRYRQLERENNTATNKIKALNDYIDGQEMTAEVLRRIHFEDVQALQSSMAVLRAEVRDKEHELAYMTRAREESDETIELVRTRCDMAQEQLWAQVARFRSMYLQQWEVETYPDLSHLEPELANPDLTYPEMAYPDVTDMTEFQITYPT